MADDSVDSVEIVAQAIDEAHLNCDNAPTDGYYLTWKNSNSKFEWKDIDTDSVTESDFNFEDESANTNGSTTEFTMTNKPVVNSCQVFLNGLLQQEGALKDYVLSVADPYTVTFGTAPAATDLLLIFYVQDD